MCTALQSSPPDQLGPTDSSEEASFLSQGIHERSGEKKQQEPAEKGGRMNKPAHAMECPTAKNEVTLTVHLCRSRAREVIMPETPRRVSTICLKRQQVLLRINEPESKG